MKYQYTFVRQRGERWQGALKRKTMAVYVALFTGMRLGEIAGLCWRNVDFDNSVIHVEASIGQSSEGGTYEKGTKANATRDIPLSKTLAPILKVMERPTFCGVEVTTHEEREDR